MFLEPYNIDFVTRSRRAALSVIRHPYREAARLAARVAWPDRLERYFDEIGFHRSSTMSATICRPILHIDKNQSHTPIEASIVGMQGLTVFLGTHINIKK